MTPLASLKLEINPTATVTADDFESDGSDPRSMEISTGDAPTEATSEDGDAVWSILSNAFFVSGGFVYLLGASWSYAIYSKTDDPDNLDLRAVLSALAYTIYQAIWILGPLIYFLNSIIDVKWALIVKARKAARKSYLEKLKAETPATRDQSGTGGGLLSNLRRLIKRNVGSRRSLGAASTFGLGALMGLLAAVLGLKATDISLSQGKIDSLYAWAATLGSGSVHLYLVSAILSLWKPPSAWLAMCNPSSAGGTGNVAAGSTVAGIPWYSNPRILFNYGDVLFGSAAVIDVCLADASIDDGFLSLPVASSLLWTVDALLYLRGDICTFYPQKKIENDTSDNATPDIVEEIV
jgi:hypothetical protein